MTRVGVGTSTRASTAEAVAEAFEHGLASLDGAPAKLAIVSCTVEHAVDHVRGQLERIAPGLPIAGATSSLGVLYRDGFAMSAAGSVGVFLLAGDGLETATSYEQVRDSASIAAGEAAAARLREKLRATPSVLLMFGVPGCEEGLLAGVDRALPEVPLIGGSAADHAIAGGWSVVQNDGCSSRGIALAGIGGSLRMGTSFRAPYRVRGGVQAVLTESDGRNLVRLNDRPAAEVIGEWVGTGVQTQLEKGGPILAQTALAPIGFDEPLRCVHPAHVNGATQTVEVFAEIPTGATVYALEAEPETLIRALDDALDDALADGGLAAEDVRGAFLIYCAGCAGAVGPALDRGVAEWASRLPGVPLMGLCTFGEQGFVPGHGNRHGNLSVGLVLFA